VSRGRIVVVGLNEPYPFGQANGRWQHALLKGLAERGYEVRCLAITTKPAWAKGARDVLDGTGVHLSLYPIQGAERRSWLGRKWRTLRAPFSAVLTDELRHDLDAELAKGYDVLHLEQLWAGYLAPGRDRALTSIHHLERLDLEGVWRASVEFLSAKGLMFWAEGRLRGRLRHVPTTTDRLEGAVQAVNRTGYRPC
jgi:hypothetical protein